MYKIKLHQIFYSFVNTLPHSYMVQVIRKVIRRVSTPTPDNQGGDRLFRDLQHSPVLQEDGSEVGMKIALLFCVWVSGLKGRMMLQ